MTISSSTADGQLTIKIGKKLDYNCIQEFRNSYTNNKDQKNVTVDFSETEYIDSSALGMILNMRQDYGEVDGKICLSNCRSHLKKIFKISSFHKHFRIS